MDLDALQQDSFEAWVQFDEDSEVLIAYVPRDELQAMARKATEMRFVKHQRQQDYNATEADRLLGRRAVKNWRALSGRPGFTMKGEPFPYTPENCDLLMTKWVDFARFVNETCVDLAALVDADNEATRKNSSSTSGQE